jgi:gas vesicle protein
VLNYHTSYNPCFWAKYRIKLGEWCLIYTISVHKNYIHQRGDWYDSFTYPQNIAHLNSISMTTKSKIILGLVGAAAAGVVVGLLLAPEKGTELRSKVSQKAGDWTGYLSDLFASAKEEASNLGKKGSKAAADAGNRFNNITESYS